MNYQAIERHEGALKAYYQVREANSKKLCMVWFQVYDILEKAKQWRQ